MSRIKNWYRPGQDSEADWAASVSFSTNSGTGLWITTHSEPVLDKQLASSAAFLAHPAAKALDLQPAESNEQAIWAAAFPRLKQSGAVWVSSGIIANLPIPKSISTALLDIVSRGITIETETDPSMPFDPTQATVPLADQGRPFDKLLSKRLYDLTKGPVLAGLLLANGEDDASHRVSQSSEGQRDYDYWHGLMHRREPDFGNASYWFRRVGNHPAFTTLPDAIGKRLKDAGFEDVDLSSLNPWDPYAMIERCRDALRNGGEFEKLTRIIQQAEMAHLLEHVMAI